MWYEYYRSRESSSISQTLMCHKSKMSKLYLLRIHSQLNGVDCEYERVFRQKQINSVLLNLEWL